MNSVGGRRVDVVIGVVLQNRRVVMVYLGQCQSPIVNYVSNLFIIM